MKLLILSSALLSPYHRATAFSSHVLNRPFIQTTPSSDAPADMPSATKLSAIIYGWDDDDSDEADEGVPFYSASESEFGVQQCPPEGIAVAESLMRDPNRMGSFARLAAAFSPPERGVGITDIERVEVLCVRENQIELEAILCENSGCVSLSVPIKFPNDCGRQWLDSGCVIQNLDVLDTKAESFLVDMNAQASLNGMSGAELDELCLLNEKIPLPSWWVPPECDANLAADCDNIKSLLNEAEFHQDIVALAQDGLAHHAVGQTGDYQVQRAKVVAVGPAGVCLKVAAIQFSQPGRGQQYMDVVYPFGGDPVTDVKELRASVLGAIAAAEDKRPPQGYYP